MLAAAAWVVLGLAVLVAGAEMIVRSGSAIAVRLGVSPLIIGLTFVAIGTSAPELGVGIEAALEGKGSIAVGNIAGTNTVNILLILGVSAALRPLALHVRTVRIEVPAIVISSLTLAALAYDGQLSRLEGFLLVALGLAFTWLVVRTAKHDSSSVKRASAVGSGLAKFRIISPRAAGEALILAAGIAVIVLGAHLLVDGAVTLAKLWNLSDAFIGLTVVAIGTSAPELVTTIVSTIRNNRDIAVGNLIGSSVYNILVILGATCLVPANPILVEDELIRIDIPIMVAVALVCVPVFYSGRRVSRTEGALFVTAYIAYLAYLLTART
jgi:cation:H+ antiporter